MRAVDGDVSVTPSVGSPKGEIAVELYWLRLGAVNRSVQWNGRVFEAFDAVRRRRQRCDIYHASLAIQMPEGRIVIEMAPVPDGHGADRGVVVRVRSEPDGRDGSGSSVTR